ncbi:hypothetical protein BC834DRAFT_400088 [Gloeopeniophorella convolvens]|nr:hypothetical protein BC834DRAFT_400088 [Gloeopeniophorella convolvens]
MSLGVLAVPASACSYAGPKPRIARTGSHSFRGLARSRSALRSRVPAWEAPVRPYNHTHQHAATRYALRIRSAYIPTPMSPNIISWMTSVDDYTNISLTSPISSQSAAPSVASIDSILAGEETLAGPNAQVAQPTTESQVKPLPSVPMLSEPKTPINLRPAQDEGPSFVRHDTYYFEDGNITFLVRAAPHPTLPPIDAHRTSYCRWMVCCTACTAISSRGTRCTSPESLRSSISENTRRFLRSYPWAT